MDIFSVIEENAANELVQRAAELPVQPTIMDIANFLGVSRSTAYKLAHSEGVSFYPAPGLSQTADLQKALSGLVCKAPAGKWY